jgi:hypothetical protein
MIDFWEYLEEKHENEIIYKIYRVTGESTEKSLLKNLPQHKKILRCVFDDYADILEMKDYLIEYANILCDTNKNFKDREMAFLLLRDFIWLKALNFGSYDRESGKYIETVDPLMRIKKSEDSFWQRLFSDRENKKDKGAYKAQQELLEQIQKDAIFLEKVIKAVYAEQKSTE